MMPSTISQSSQENRNCIQHFNKVNSIKKMCVRKGVRGHLKSKKGKLKVRDIRTKTRGLALLSPLLHSTGIRNSFLEQI